MLESRPSTWRLIQSGIESLCQGAGSDPPYFEYLVKRQHHYGYTVMFNINICRNNMDDVKELTEIAHDAGIATDYHINETPMMEQDHFKHLDENVPI